MLYTRYKLILDFERGTLGVSEEKKGSTYEEEL